MRVILQNRADEQKTVKGKRSEVERKRTQEADNLWEDEKENR